MMGAVFAAVHESAPGLGPSPTFDALPEMSAIGCEADIVNP
jgi:hypothetical protein